MARTKKSILETASHEESQPAKVAHNRPGLALLARTLIKPRKGIMAWGFMMPFLSLNIVVVLGPSLAAVYYSLTNWNGLNDPQFVGLQNYLDLLQDMSFLEAFIHNLLWVGLNMTVPIAMSLFGSFMLSQIKHFQRFFRIAFFLPYTVSSIISATIWQNLLDPDRGIARILSRIGITALNNEYFLADSRVALPTVIFIQSWANWGFLILLFLAAMQGVNQELYDAASIDGANAWRQYLHVTLPGILPTLMFVVLINITDALLTFDFVFVLTHGGPAGATEVVGTLLYQEVFTLNAAGYATAMGLTMSGICGVVMLGYVYLRRRGWEI